MFSPFIVYEAFAGHIRGKGAFRYGTVHMHDYKTLEKGCFFLFCFFLLFVCFVFLFCFSFCFVLFCFFFVTMGPVMHLGVKKLPFLSQRVGFKPCLKCFRVIFKPAFQRRTFERGKKTCLESKIVQNLCRVLFFFFLPKACDKLV